MSTRAERKVAAAALRLEWRKRWAIIARAAVEKGGTYERAARLVAEDAQRLATATPQIKSEILRAANEFMTKLAAAIVVAGSQAYQKKHSSP